MGGLAIVAPGGPQALARRARTPDDRPKRLAPGAAAVASRRQRPRESPPLASVGGRAITDHLFTKEEQMLNAPTLEQLQALKLSAMATAWTEQQQQADMTALAFDERFALLVDAEWRARENKRLARALQAAKLKLSQACLEAIDYPARRELDKALIRQLATCRWSRNTKGSLSPG